MQPAEILELRELVEDAARHVLPSCGIFIGEPFDPVDALDDTKQLVAFMGFTGPVLRGTLALVAPAELMRASYPIPLNGNPYEVFEVFDWTGEVTNRLLGRVKNGLASRGVAIEASTPRVMLAHQLHVTRSVQGTVCSTCFTSGSSWIKVWFDATAPEDQQVLGSSLPDNAALLEGEVVIF